MLRRLIVFSIFSVVAIGGYFWKVGIVVATTPDAFVERVGMPLFEKHEGRMNVRLGVTPAPWPEEARTMYRAAILKLPVKVELLSKTNRKIYFEIMGLSEDGDFLVPCFSKTECMSILESADIRIPPELVS
jgi:hypothetical protein